MIVDRDKLEELYLSYFNDFLTVACFAEHYGFSEGVANMVIDQGRIVNHERALQ